jgi:hypothetical protein
MFFRGIAKRLPLGVLISVADPDPFDTDLDPAFHFDMDQDPAFHFDNGSGCLIRIWILTVTKRQLYLKQYFLYIFT